MALFDSVEKFTQTPTGMLLSSGEKLLEIRFVADDILRIRLAPNGIFSEEPSFVVEDCPTGATQVRVVERGDRIEAATQKVKVVIGRNPFSLSIEDLSGRVIVDTPRNSLEVANGRAIQRFRLFADEGIYGLGQGTYPHLNLRDRERRMWHEWRGYSQSGPAGIPLMLSTRGYGFLLNSSWPSRFAIGRAELAPPPDPATARTWAPAPWPPEEHSGEDNPDDIAILLDNEQLDYFLIIRRTFPEILGGYAELTGASPIPPQWALGYIQCKNRYRGLEEILEVARGFRKRGIPGDVLVIDWLWFKTFGDLTWDRKTWPDPGAMARELASMGFKLMQAQHPFIDEGALTWDEFSDKGYLVKFTDADQSGQLISHQSIYDFTNPQARADWWKKVQKLFDDGIRGYWTDMGEPELHPVGCRHYLGSRERVHNIYSLLWVKGLYEGQRSYTDQRVFSLPRTAYAGIQRYGAALWSGDISCTWEVLRNQVIIGQQVCMSGQPYWTTDIGGFMLPSFYEPELYVRWLQWGMWCPIFRTHGTRPANEPWSFGPDAEEIITRFIKLRYELMPYIYAQAWHTHKTGVPMMQAMVMRYPGDRKAVQSELQFMFGPSFLVAPVVERGARARKVYLPEGKWYDYWTDQEVCGPVEIEAFAPLERIPVYVKAGSIVPTVAGMLHTGEKAWDPLLIHVYPGGDAEFVLYEDDGATYGYERGESAKTEIEYHEATRSLVINGVEGRYPGQPRARSYQVIFHDQERPEKVILDGKPVTGLSDYDGSYDGSYVDDEHEPGWRYYARSRRLVVSVPHRPLEQVTSILVVSQAAPQVSQAPLAVDAVGALAAGEGAGAPREEKAAPGPEAGRIGKIGVDVSRPGPRTAIVYAYIEKSSEKGFMGDEGTPVIWELSAPLGWRCSRLNIRPEETPVGVAAFAAWELEVEGDEFTPGSEATVTASLAGGDGGGGQSKLSKTVQLHSKYHTHWYILGPLPGDGGAGFDRVYPPEMEEYLDVAATYEGVEGQAVTWRRYDGFDCFGYVNLRGITSERKEPWEIRRPEYWLAYAAGKVWSREARHAYIELLGEDRFKVWVNGELVILASDRPAFRPVRARVELRQGWNTILVKSTQDATREWGGRSWGFYLSIVDDEGRVMNDLRYAAAVGQDR
ncbi:MAG TPA: glycoside hydrolase family 31 protein [Firmicutes bacterium]|nr:glycoside hydrolase family 31 protein [Bacillota bacterium]